MEKKSKMIKVTVTTSSFALAILRLLMDGEEKKQPRNSIDFGSESAQVFSVDGWVG
jgi:hypothetical protein